MSAGDALQSKQFGSFFHGTNVALKPGALIYGEPHAYFTTLEEHAANYADAAYDRSGEGEPRVYHVKPTGPHEVDPHDIGEGEPVSFRSQHPLRVL